MAKPAQPEPRGSIGSLRGLPFPTTASNWKERTLWQLNIRIIAEDQSDFLKPNCNLLLDEQESDSPLKKEVRGHVHKLVTMMESWTVETTVSSEKYFEAQERLEESKLPMGGRLSDVLAHLLSVYSPSATEMQTQCLVNDLVNTVIGVGNRKLKVETRNLSTSMGGKSVTVAGEQEQEVKVGARSDLALLSRKDQVFLVFWELKRLLEWLAKIASAKEDLKVRVGSLLSGFEPKPQAVLQAIAIANHNITQVGSVYKKGVPVPEVGVCREAAPGHPATAAANSIFMCPVIGDRIAFLRFCTTEEFLRGFEASEYRPWLQSGASRVHKYMVPPTDVKQLAVDGKVWFNFTVPKEREIILKVLGSLRIGAETWVEKYEEKKK
jgi:hypothetical protein